MLRSPSSGATCFNYVAREKLVRSSVCSITLGRISGGLGRNSVCVMRRFDAAQLGLRTKIRRCARSPKYDRYTDVDRLFETIHNGNHQSLGFFVSLVTSKIWIRLAGNYTIRELNPSITIISMASPCVCVCVFLLTIIYEKRHF